MISTTRVRLASWPAVKNKVGDSAVADTVKDGDDPTTSETGEDFDDSEDERPDRYGGFDSIQELAGPGMRLGTYLPKHMALIKIFSASLTPFR